MSGAATSMLGENKTSLSNVFGFRRAQPIALRLTSPHHPQATPCCHLGGFERGFHSVFVPFSSCIPHYFYLYFRLFWASLEPAQQRKYLSACV